MGAFIFCVAFLVCLAVVPSAVRSKRVPDNVIQMVPRSRPAKASVEAAGEVIEFPIKKGK